MAANWIGKLDRPGCNGGMDNVVDRPGCNCGIDNGVDWPGCNGGFDDFVWLALQHSLTDLGMEQGDPTHSICSDHVSTYMFKEKATLLVLEEDLVVGVHACVALLLPLALGKSSDHLSRTLVFHFLERIYERPYAMSILKFGKDKKGSNLVPALYSKYLLKATKLRTSSIKVEQTTFMQLQKILEKLNEENSRKAISLEILEQTVEFRRIKNKMTVGKEATVLW
ncbi:hypothetical protein AMTR_s00025p00248280 [Amborella trichopoda]|uniref:Uncharacterized protein n=1 Tax=Amborella trichopoda TaxID=13333 RepID=W1PXJ8_AMBTC|nr:hypothetical protein AMTR_s00025p00248280 [Amborella trichopoda]